MLKDLVLRNRSYRRFDASCPVPEADLKALVELARFTPSTVNSQALKFRLVHEKEEADKVFPCLVWAAALKDWPGPDEEERPTAYIVILCDQEL
ncbi:MAG: nitroreductase family protein, partial [Christensenellaceae bacterium]